MEVPLAMLADAANFGEGGKLNILGVFGAIFAKEFPARHEQMALVMRFTCLSGEFGQEKDIKVTLVEQDGREVSSVEGKLRVPKPKTPHLRIDHIMMIENLVFPHAGDYAFHVLIGGETKVTVPVTLIKQDAEHDNPTKT